MHIAIAPFRLKADVTEDEMLAASDQFEAQFVTTQEGILRRTLVRDGETGGYADIVFFEDLAAIERVIEAERASDVCAAFFSIMEAGEHRVYEVVKTYE